MNEDTSVTTGSVELLGTQGTNLSLTGNIIYGGYGPGIRSNQGLGFYPFEHNDIYANNPNYSGVENQTGINGNISLDPLLNTGDPSYCLLPSSPAIYGNANLSEYMGHIGLCNIVPSPEPTVNPSPTPTPSPTPSLSPTPTPMPVAGDVNGDGHVNIVDIGILVDNYRRDPIIDIRADLNNDGVVNIVDIGISVDNYGT